VNLRANKDMVPRVEADATAEMLHEMIGADIVDAATAGGTRLIKTGIGRTDASQQVSAKPMTQMRLPEQVEVGEDGAVVFFSGEIDALSCSPGGFDVKADVFVWNHIATEVDVKTAFFRREACAGIGG